MNVYYAETKVKQKCTTCDMLTRGVLVIRNGNNPLTQQVSFCPRCRDTKTKRDELGRKLGISLDHITREESTLELPKSMIMRPQKGVSYWDLPEEKQKQIENDPNWIAEPKWDGMRGHMYFWNDKVFLLSGRESKKTGDYSDRINNFPHLRPSLSAFSWYNDTILDGEVFIEVKGKFKTLSSETTSTLNVTVACAIASPETAVKMQLENDALARYYVFDCLMFKGKDVRYLPLSERRKLVAEVVSSLNNINIRNAPICFNKPLAYEEYVKQGYEGVVLKNLNSSYYNPSVGARNRGMIKKKKMETYDGFITGSLPGRAGFKGLVGALLISAYDSVAGVVTKPFEFAAVSNIPLEKRKEMTDLSLPGAGKLKNEYLNRVVEVRAQTKTSSGRLRHATLLRWRPDKKPEECYYEPYKIS